MGIAPIDLQAIYANMNNVAKNVSSQQQGAQLAQQLQESKMIQQDAEKAKAVHKAADNDAKSGIVKNERRGSQKFEKSGQKKSRGGEENAEPSPKTTSEIREEYLGRHINIEG